MSTPKDDIDVRFFTEHADRKYRIREPVKVTVFDRQRGAHVVDECEPEFRSLGDHRRDRRRIILCRSDHRGNLLPDGRVLKIPMLAFGDEEIVDNDSTLGPIVYEIMSARDT